MTTATSHPTSHPTSDAAVHARGLVKTFGDVRAVDGIDLDVHRGHVFGVLGRFGLEDAGDRAIAKYSGGIRRRLDLDAS